MTSDLGYWLDDAAKILGRNGSTDHADKVREAASTIRAQAAEIERLRAEKDEFWKLVCDNNDFALKQQFKAEFTEAKLREAVEVMRDITERGMFSSKDRLVEHLRAFLATMEKQDVK